MWHAAGFAAASRRCVDVASVVVVSMTTWLLPALGLVVVEHGDALRVSGRARGGCSVVAGVQG